MDDSCNEKTIYLLSLKMTNFYTHVIEGWSDPIGRGANPAILDDRIRSDPFRRNPITYGNFRLNPTVGSGRFR